MTDKKKKKTPLQDQKETLTKIHEAEVNHLEFQIGKAEYEKDLIKRELCVMTRRFINELSYYQIEKSIHLSSFVTIRDDLTETFYRRTKSRNCLARNILFMIVWICFITFVVNGIVDWMWS